MVEINKQLFNKLVLNPNSISLDESIYMKDLIKKYPYFQVAKVIELIGFKKFDNIKFKNALKNTSIYSSNRSILHDIIELNKIKSKENSRILSTVKTKNSFIKWLKASKLSTNNKSSQNSIIDNFLSSNHQIVPKQDYSSKDFSKEFQPSKSEFMTETLAKKYFEQKKFKEAIKAYEILCLKYPEKIILFADQIKTIKEYLKNK